MYYKILHSPCSPAGAGVYLDSNAPSSIPDADYYPPLFELNQASFRNTPLEGSNILQNTA